jgi:uncharacterized repeat protein (TIGR03803 family)
MYDQGTVFEFTPAAAGSWTESILHNFASNPDGAEPYYGNLILDAGGNLYGTTEQGGASGNGTAFELVPGAGGIWTETVLHSFNDNGADGYNPLGALVRDGEGNLYGTTELVGGTYNGGIVFEIKP